MKYLDDEEMLKSIEEYLNKDTDYAILVDGKWGCGKTHFIDNCLIPKLKENKEKEYVKVSLFGVTSKDEVDRIINIEKLKRVENFGLILSAGYKYSDSLLDLCKDELKGPFKKIAGKFKPSEIIKKISCFEDTIIIFDDLERSSMGINETLGMISSYINDEKCKCIVVGNQEEIGKVKLSKNLELKYIAAASSKNKIIFKEEQDSKQKNIYSMPIEEKTEISKTELNNKVEELFSENIEYKKIKEKVIGRTLYYKPNIHEIFIELIKKANISIEAKEYIYNNESDIMDIFYDYNYNNIRTLIFIVDIYEKVFSILDNIKIKKELEKYFMELKHNILLYIVYASIVEKTNKRRKRWSGEYTDIDIGNQKENFYVTGFRFIDDIIDIGCTDSQNISYVVKAYLEIKDKNSTGLDNPMNILKYYWENDEMVVRENLEKLKKLILADNYEIEYYSEIIAVLVKLKKFGIEIDDILEIMKRKAESQTKNSIYGFEMYDGSFDTMEENNEYNNLIHQFTEILYNSRNEGKIAEINKILEEEDFGKNLAELYRRGNYGSYFENGILKYFNIENLLKAIERANMKNISDFRRFIASGYNRMTKDVYNGEKEKVLQLLTGIEKMLESENEFDEIKKWSLKQIAEILIKTKLKFEGELQ